MKEEITQKEKLYAEINQECIQNRDLKAQVELEKQIQLDRIERAKECEWRQRMEEAKIILAEHRKEIESINNARQEYLQKEQEREAKQQRIKSKFNRKRIEFREKKRQKKVSFT